MFATGLKHHRAGNFAPAEEYYTRVLRSSPSHVGAIHFLGLLYYETGRADEGLELLRQSVSLAPNDAAFQLNLGGVYARRLMFAEAIIYFEEAVRLKPDLTEAHANLGLSLESLGRFEDAAAAYARAVALAPDAAELAAHHTRALALAGRPVPLSAIASKAKGDLWFHALDALGLAYEHQGQLHDAISARIKQCSLKRDPAAHSSLVRLMLFDPAVTAEQLSGAHRRWGNMHASSLPPMRRIRDASNPRSDARVRIGYLSPHFKLHPVGRFVKPLLRNHDRNRFHVTCYSDRLVPDRTTARLRQESDAWRDTGRLSDAQLCELVASDAIDVLVELSGHMAPHRLLVVAQRPAPVQISYLYPHSPGLEAFDGRLTDGWADPVSAAEQYSVERLIRLPGTAWCYPPPEDAPDVCDPPVLSTGTITFGSLNQSLKINSVVVACWARILLAVPRARLLVLVDPGPSGNNVRSAFARHGVPAERIHTAMRRAHREYFELTREIDIALDTFPFNGHTTTYDMLWMGLPVVTLAGATPQARVGVGLLNNLGAPEWVASSMDEYVSIAAGLANDPAGLRLIRRTLRDRMRASILMDEAGFTRRIEDAIWNLGRRI